MRGIRVCRCASVRASEAIGVREGVQGGLGDLTASPGRWLRAPPPNPSLRPPRLGAPLPLGVSPAETLMLGTLLLRGKRWRKG